jgi:hypothetical protein
MNPFRYERASDAESAVALLAQAPNGVFLGGATSPGGKRRGDFSPQFSPLNCP